MFHRRLALGLAALVSAGLLACVLLADEPEQGRRYALVVGVQNYEGTELGSLRYCDNDAAGLAATLGKRGYRVTLLTRPEWKANDRDDLLPTADNIRAHLKAILRNRKPADTVLLAFSGHGEQLKKDGKMYFCPAKCDLDRPETLIALDEVYGLLKDNAARAKVLIVDACRNDPLAGKTVGSEQLESVTRPELPDPPGGTVALFSCSKGEKAYESTALQHGFLFHFVIDGLEGKAAGKGGRIKWTDLTRHVDDELSDAVVHELGPNAVQTPEVRGESHGLVLAQIIDVGSAPPDAATTESDEKTEEFEYTVGRQKRHGMRRVLTLDLGGGVTMEFVRIPHGTFLMGSPDSDKDAGGGDYDVPGDGFTHIASPDSDKDAGGGDKPQHEVTITKDFYLGKYLVTQEQYKAVVGENPSWFSASGGGKDKVAGLNTTRFPVEQVSWEDAQVFCQKLSEKSHHWKAALPTEAQWEYACRAGTATCFPCGDELAAADANINTTLDRTSAVGSYPANPFGLYDMVGNVYEWCADYYDPKYYINSPNKDPQNLEKAEARVLRGGSWGYNPGYCRAACRLGVRPASVAATSAAASPCAWTDLHDALCSVTLFPLPRAERALRAGKRAIVYLLHLQYDCRRPAPFISGPRRCCGPRRPPHGRTAASRSPGRTARTDRRPATPCCG